ncbi:MAG: hypothetical protein GXO36_02100 [Chloroflexi bacterium]|nr:hypothetical protein [Chloroflexota bacterium]
MGISRWWAVALLSLVLLAGCQKPRQGLAPDADPNALPPLGGEYRVKGYDPVMDDKYGGTFVLTRREDGTFEAVWLIRELILRGRGHVEGNQLVLTWESEFAPGPMHGIARYTITRAGQLYGERITQLEDGTEHAVREEMHPPR